MQKKDVDPEAFKHCLSVLNKHYDWKEKPIVVAKAKDPVTQPADSSVTQAKPNSSVRVWNCPFCRI